MAILPINHWGGMNARDQADALIMRSHQPVQGGFAQIPGVGIESPDLLNVDYDPQGLKKRLGSASYADLSSVLVASEVVLGGFEFRAVGGSRAEFVVGKKSIYTNQSGSWAQINNSSSAAYTHDSDVTKFTVAVGDGHWFVGTDGANNEIQTWKSGADLDPEMKNANNYEDAYGAGTNAYTGTWPTGAFMVAVVHGRLCWSDGSVLIEYTPMAHTSSSGIWDLAGSGAGAFHAGGDIRFMTNFVPEGGNADADEVLMVGTSIGIEMTTGFLASDRLNRVEDEAPLNHQAFAKAQNWVVYLTDRKNIKAFNGSEIIDIGARLKSSDQDGPLDSMSISDSEDDAFGIYNADKQQVMLWYTTDSARVNDSCAVVDFKQGEPLPRESRSSYERRVRLLHWQIISPDDNDWFVHAYQKSGSVIGVMADGTMFTTESGRNDLGSLAVDAHWKSPIINGGQMVATNQKQWGRLSPRALQNGAWDVTFYHYFDREGDEYETWTMQQASPNAAIVGVAVVGDAIVSSGGFVRDFRRVARRTEMFQFMFENSNADEDFTFTNLSLDFEIGAQVS